MRGALVLVLLAAVCFFFEGKAQALSDAEHARFLRESPAYAKAEKRLAETWRKVRKSLPRAEFQRVLEEQRVWLSSLRDEEVKAESGAASLAEAYALVTGRRAAALERTLPGKNAAQDKHPPAAEQPVSMTAEKNLSPASPAPSLTPPLLSGDAATATGLRPGDVPAVVPQADSGPQELPHALRPIPPLQVSSGGVVPGRSLAGAYEKELGRVDIEAVGDAFKVSVQTSAPDARWLCETAGMARLEGNALILNNDSVNSDAQPVRIAVEGDKLIIGYEHPDDICGVGGTIGGVYVKKKERTVQ